MRSTVWSLVCVLMMAYCAAAGAQAAPPAEKPEPHQFTSWHGGEVVRDQPARYEGALRWNHGQDNSIGPDQIPQDWSAYNGLSFELYCPDATGAEFMIIIKSENEATPGMDYYMAEVKLDFKGAKQFELYIPHDFARARSPLGWDNITDMYLTASGWGNEPDLDTTVIVANMTLSWEDYRMGPRMTDQQFFEALNLDYPGLQDTKRLFSAGDLDAAKSAFVHHIKTRQQPTYYIDWRDKPDPDERPANPDISQAAQDALNLQYTVCGIPFQFEDQIDWTANPTDPFNPEWTWQFGRFHWWDDLGRAYWQTGDGEYAGQFVRELRSWVRSNLMPNHCDNSVGSRWRTIECGIRLAGNWPRAFYYFLPSPSFTDEDVVMMVKSFAEQAEYLHRYPQGGNWLTMEANGMGHVGVLFPEFKRADAWRGDAIARLHRELDSQVYPDGPQKELSTGYHYVSLRNFLGLARICMHNDVSLPDDYIAKLERMWAAGMWAMMPDRTLPHVNDAWHVNVPATLRQALEYFPQRDDFRWIATGGAEGSPPEHLSHLFPWAGWAVMRSGWQKDSNYLFFDVGPFGYGHQHEDKLSFVIHAYGSYLLRDVGSYAYERSKMRSYVLSPRAHNTVLVDGHGQHRRGQHETYVNEGPQQNPWHTTDALDFCRATYDSGFGGDADKTVTHTRTILFIKPEYWIALDTLRPSDRAEHEYRSLFHLNTDDAQAEDGYARTLSDSANLHILAAGADVEATIIQGQTEPYYLGWAGRHGSHGKHPIPVACFDWQATGTSNVLYVLYPTRPDQMLPVGNVELTHGDGEIAAEIHFKDGRTDTISIAESLWRVRRTDAGGDTTAVLSVQP